jgi:hypothetical protein
MKTTNLVAALVAVALPGTAVAQSAIVIHRDPGCGCCVKWAEQARQTLNRPIRIVDTPNRAVVAKRLGIPSDHGSCHTAIIDGLVFEGHVPLNDVRRVLAIKPKGVRGLGVAGMPLGSPGMEVPGMKAQPYDVIAFGPGGKRVFARH